MNRRVPADINATPDHHYISPDDCCTGLMQSPPATNASEPPVQTSCRTDTALPAIRTLDHIRRCDFVQITKQPHSELCSDATAGRLLQGQCISFIHRFAHLLWINANCTLHGNTSLTVDHVRHYSLLSCFGIGRTFSQLFCAVTSDCKFVTL